VSRCRLAWAVGPVGRLGVTLEEKTLLANNRDIANGIYGSCSRYGARSTSTFAMSRLFASKVFSSSVTEVTLSSRRGRHSGRSCVHVWDDCITCDFLFCLTLCVNSGRIVTILSGPLRRKLRVYRRVRRERRERRNRSLSTSLFL
jgi:hypothetical protein